MQYSEHQPGDWICLRCNYLNWRRRKVCQTCFPCKCPPLPPVIASSFHDDLSIDAEGNGDSISAAVQSERIALLTSVLAQAQTLPPPSSYTTPLSHGPRSHSLTPPQYQTPFVDISPPPKSHAPVHRSHSHFDLGTRYVTSRPIYQTSGYRQSPPPSPSAAGDGAFHIHAPAPLLPSFLQDIVQSPTLSPTSTSSADLSFEELDDNAHSPAQPPRGHITSAAESSPLGNIWRLDGEETKSLSAFALPNHQDLMGKSSREVLRPAA
jgi:hypothetical protein